jgi:hypothetical protein
MVQDVSVTLIMAGLKTSPESLRRSGGLRTRDPHIRTRGHEDRPLIARAAA